VLIKILFRRRNIEHNGMYAYTYVCMYVLLLLLLLLSSSSESPNTSQRGDSPFNVVKRTIVVSEKH